MKRTVHVSYVAMLKERAGVSMEDISTSASTVREIFDEIAAKYNWPWSHTSLRPALNDNICDWCTPLNDQDRVLFLPPSSGG